MKRGITQAATTAEPKRFGLIVYFSSSDERETFKRDARAAGRSASNYARRCWRVVKGEGKGSDAPSDA